MGMYLQGEGGGVWYHDFEHHDHLPEYARVQLRSGALRKVAEPKNAVDLNPAIRPRDTDPKSRWASYLSRGLGQPLSESDVASMSRKEMIEWANELEAEAKA
jgi:hypothetical protein